MIRVQEGAPELTQLLGGVLRARTSQELAQKALGRCVQELQRSPSIGPNNVKAPPCSRAHVVAGAEVHGGGGGKRPGLWWSMNPDGLDGYMLLGNVLLGQLVAGSH